MNHDVVSGKLKQVSGSVRQLRGHLGHNYREVAIGHLLRTAGLLQERRGRVLRRWQRVYKRMNLRSGLQHPGEVAG